MIVRVHMLHLQLCLWKLSTRSALTRCGAVRALHDTKIFSLVYTGHVLFLLSGGQSKPRIGPKWRHCASQCGQRGQLPCQPPSGHYCIMHSRRFGEIRLVRYGCPLGFFSWWLRSSELSRHVEEKYTLVKLSSQAWLDGWCNRMGENGTHQVIPMCSISPS